MPALRQREGEQEGGEGVVEGGEEEGWKEGGEGGVEEEGGGQDDTPRFLYMRHNVCSS